ncbi:MAG TPA: Ig-like domain-containing protein, partial [Bacilli bacterium]|nr:Ig-like domain-containing protein [Bacilli bacterium]
EVAENFAQSKLLYPNDFFAKAYKIDLLEGEDVISSFRPLDNQTSVIIPNLNAGVYQKNYKVNVYFRDGQMATKDLEITNPHAVFGTIDNVRVSGKNLIWNSQIDNAMLQKIVVSANGIPLGEVSPTTKEISLESLNDKQVNNIIFSALDAEGNVLFTTSLTYGEEYIPYSVSFTDDNAQLEVGEDKTLQVTVLPNLDVTLVFTSSDSSIVRIDEGKIIAVKAGEAIITVTVTDHPEATDTLAVKVVKVEEEVVEPTEPVDPVEPVEPETPVKETGCKSAMSLWYLLIPLGLVILRKKKY